MTVEFAMVLPAVLLCLALCLAAVQAAAQQIRLVDAAATAARLLARGDSADAAPISSGARMESEREDGLVCVRVSAESAGGVLGSLGLQLGARACALDETTAEALRE
ncbi:MAG TPA: TadE family type IV pilus minor pilin [Leifsonia sp.]